MLRCALRTHLAAPPCPVEYQLRGRTKTKLTAGEAMRVQQRIKGPLVMRGPIARGQLVVEGVELKLDLDDALYQQPLRN